ncbi:thermophilic serine proteinase precursor [bacterium BMS3Abin05]|nr:thermophilic serine proteinase precursor [bacterium BMS3Abin05]
MKSNKIGFLLIFGLIFCGQPEAHAQTVPGEIVVKVRPSAVAAERNGKFRLPASVLKSLPARVRSVVPVFTPFHSQKKSLRKNIFDFKRQFFLLRYRASVNSDSLIQALQALPQIAYAVQNRVFQIEWTPDDPGFDRQWGLRKIEAEQAWDITRGDPSVLLAVIDTGIDYNHPDLRKSIWINPGEDLNHNGRVDSSDFNGVDDDGNGFVDDIQGWDFVDAPNYPDGGDYRKRDDNPADGNGHGTAIAGILAAQANNGIGVAGVAPDCRVMNLRAGTSRGLLEEDDVAAAIVYAVENGARVINMSFGDVEITRFLRDVIQFAYRNNVLCVASSGNSGSSRIHYPSGLEETLSVGASTNYDARASFSNYGVSLDLVAPGNQIYTTLRQNSYGTVSGTSASAPFVTGAAGLVLSVHPDYSAEMLRHILTSTCDDPGPSGWDSTFGAGRLNVYRALQVSGAPAAEIISPRMDQGFSGGEIPIVGRATSPLFQKAEVSVGIGENPRKWTLLKTISDYQVVDDTLAHWTIPPGPDTSRVIRLRVLNSDGTETDDFVRIFVDHSPPAVQDSLTLEPMIAGNNRVLLGQFTTGDVSEAVLFYRVQGSSGAFQKKILPFTGKTHGFLISPVSFPEAGEFYFQLKNRAGLTRIYRSGDHFFHWALANAAYEQFAAESLPLNLPSGYLLPKVTDFNGNGRPEIVMNQLKKNQYFGNLAIYEWENGHFNEQYKTNYIAIPRDAGDVNGDGRPELLAGAGGTSYLFEVPEGGKWPSKLVWQDTADVWASRLVDLDGDGRKDILARKGNVFTMFRNLGNFQFSPTDSFPNPTAGTNGTGVPHVEIGDFTGTGRKDLLFGDYDGDVILYEISGTGRPKVIWTDRLPFMDTIDFLASGDFNGDGVTDFAVGCHSGPDLDLEHTFDNRRWFVRIYTHAGGDSFRVAWQEAFYGFQPPKNFLSGMASGDVTGDGRDELLLVFYPNFYVIHYEVSSGRFRAIRHIKPARTNTVVVHDFTGDGQNEFIFNSCDGLRQFQFYGGNRTIYKLFENFAAIPLDTQRVTLRWETLMPGLHFKLFRSEPDSSDSTLLAETGEHTFLDSSGEANHLYQYWIRSEDGVHEQTSNKISVRLHKPVRLDSVKFQSPNQFRLFFSNAILPESVRREAITIQQILPSHRSKARNPVSLVVAHGGREVIVTDSFRNLPPGTFRVRISAVTDSEGTPIDERFRTGSTAVTEEIQPPYLTRARFISPNHIHLWFNEAVDSLSAGRVKHYRIEPFISVKKAVWESGMPDQVTLILGDERPMGALGLRFKLTVQGVKNQSGTAIKKGVGDQKIFQFYKSDLSDMFTYPNPVRVGIDEKVMFANLTKTARIQIFNLSGIQVAALEEQNEDGGVSWDLKDFRGQYVPAGIYIFRVTHAAETRMGKFAVVR